MKLSHGVLTDYKQTLKLSDPSALNEQRQYSRLPPLLVKAKQAFRVLTQSGYAVGWDAQIKPPTPLFPNNLFGASDVVVEPVDAAEDEWKTTWSYTMVVDADYAVDYAAGSAWPATIEVYT